MSTSLITVRLPRLMLDLLVPEGSTFAEAWVVLLGDREQTGTTSDGRPVYGAVTSWSPVLPLPDEAEATAFALRMGESSLGGIEPDDWIWSPVSDECPALVELYGVVDGHDEQTEVAIAPLTALLAGEPQDGGQS
ncbi:hypothetical protein ABT061_15625 [Streptosporangium sp. NPDC002544]|uniref:hypothetical protein n=1 Tax=Streptosporangium sp. NPDC002544 TaxID=3154538 RepID=UPI00331A0BAA